MSRSSLAIGALSTSVDVKPMPARRLSCVERRGRPAGGMSLLELLRHAPARLRAMLLAALAVGCLAAAPAADAANARCPKQSAKQTAKQKRCKQRSKCKVKKPRCKRARPPHAVITAQPAAVQPAAAPEPAPSGVIAAGGDFAPQATTKATPARGAAPPAPGGDPS